MTEFAKVIEVYDKVCCNRHQVLIYWEQDKAAKLYLLKYLVEIDGRSQQMVWKYLKREHVVEDFRAFDQAKAEKYFESLKAVHLVFEEGGINA